MTSQTPSWSMDSHHPISLDDFTLGALSTRRSSVFQQPSPLHSLDRRREGDLNPIQLEIPATPTKHSSLKQEKAIDPYLTLQDLSPINKNNTHKKQGLSSNTLPDKDWVYQWTAAPATSATCDSITLSDYSINGGFIGTPSLILRRTQCPSLINLTAPRGSIPHERMQLIEVPQVVDLDARSPKQLTRRRLTSPPSPTPRTPTRLHSPRLSSPQRLIKPEVIVSPLNSTTIMPNRRESLTQAARITPSTEMERHQLVRSERMYSSRRPRSHTIVRTTTEQQVGSLLMVTGRTLPGSPIPSTRYRPSSPTSTRLIVHPDPKFIRRTYSPVSSPIYSSPESPPSTLHSEVGIPLVRTSLGWVRDRRPPSAVS
ncbi:hypothetical protein GMRT_11666 [Giardia muris]|uniref:Uncharacterized protein n=1 Tax=Giardia muris TaxID=5742 RepID=A0A4Z1SV43_GIAMU|nr:hypothetical protein GMRT_11666 [Giardia muris]|eukprot:TNJ29540.1 hypothetical protein GMRT_11666 [Giardia muris]